MSHRPDAPSPESVAAAEQLTDLLWGYAAQAYQALTHDSHAKILLPYVELTKRLFVSPETLTWREAEIQRTRDFSVLVPIADHRRGGPKTESLELKYSVAHAIVDTAQQQGQLPKFGQGIPPRSQVRVFAKELYSDSAREACSAISATQQLIDDPSYSNRRAADEIYQSRQQLQRNLSYLNAVHALQFSVVGAETSWDANARRVRRNETVGSCLTITTGGQARIVASAAVENGRNLDLSKPLVSDDLRLESVMTQATIDIIHSLTKTIERRAQ